MFTKTGIIDLHTATHERLSLLLRHIATVPDDLFHKPISGFGHASIWKQLVHILTCAEGWVTICRTRLFPVGTKKIAQPWRCCWLRKTGYEKRLAPMSAILRKSSLIPPFHSALWIGAANSGVQGLSCCTS